MADDIQTQLNGLTANLEEQQRVLDLLLEDQGEADDVGEPVGTGQPTPNRIGSTRHWRRRKPALAGNPTPGRRSTTKPWWNLDSLTPDDYALVVEEVITFGETVRTRYRIEHMPATWHTDRAWLEEITALMAGWQGSYNVPDAAHHQPGAWHDSLERFLNRTTSYAARHRKDRVRGD